MLSHCILTFSQVFDESRVSDHSCSPMAKFTLSKMLKIYYIVTSKEGGLKVNAERTKYVYFISCQNNVGQNYNINVAKHPLKM